MKSIQEYWDLVYRPVNKERMLQIQEYYCRIGIKVIIDAGLFDPNKRYPLTAIGQYYEQYGEEWRAHMAADGYKLPWD